MKEILIVFFLSLCSRFGPVETTTDDMSHAEVEKMLQSTIKDIEKKRSKTKSFLPKVFQKNFSRAILLFKKIFNKNCNCQASIFKKTSFIKSVLVPNISVQWCD